ncbi:tyrosine-type recombinase/integrase [uncultured Tateyamaria sp.]|uniref:tyrosine-type recombinase/integrase n=1 Tax=uncultured Tateyamaria sp. TaxID=455651 RepID=UPI00262122AA|nr:tyrosine-type recombinase/integrase [uncultured Tateyamaria sp.]
MPSITLSDRTLKNLSTPTSGQTTFWDEGLSGFGIRVSQGGAKSFVVMYGPNRTRRTIGRYPTVSLKQARDKAKELLAEFTLGLDTKRSITWSAARERFLKDCERKNKPNTVAYYRKRLDAHFKFGQRNLSDISKQDVLQRIRRIKTSASEQHHAFVAARTLFNWAIREDLLASSPLHGVKGFKPAQARERVLNDHELQAVWAEAKRAPYPYGAIIQVLILTGLRRNEAAQLEWSFVDETAGMITIPAHLTKNGRAHAIPLGKTLVQVISDLPRINQFLFPSAHEKGTVFNGWGKSKARLDAALENVDPYTLHDLRRTFATTHAKIGTSVHVTEKLLNHVSGTISGVAAIYNRHTYIEEMKVAMTAYETYLERLFDS